MISIIFDIIEVVLSILPASPFQALIPIMYDSDILGFLNWFLPFDTCLAIMQVWLTAIITFYAYRFGGNYVTQILSIFKR